MWGYPANCVKWKHFRWFLAGVQSLDFSSTQPHDKWFAQQPGRQQQAARVCYVCGEHEFRARSSQSAIGEMGTRLENFNKNAWQQDCLRDDSAAAASSFSTWRKQSHDYRCLIDCSRWRHFLIESTISRSRQNKKTRRLKSVTGPWMKGAGS